MNCPNCKGKYVVCPECGKIYLHGKFSRCTNSKCVEVNAPLECYCGLVVSDDLKGVLTPDMKLIPYKPL
jgi:hypothetical protein